MRWRSFLTLVLGISLATPALAQFPPSAEFEPGMQGSRNVKIRSHIPLGRAFSTADIEIEQELARPYSYVSRMLVHGTDIIDLRDPSKAKVLYSWRIENAELHQGNGGMDNKYFKLRGRYYDVQSFQFGQSGPDADVGAVVLDVTSLPDTSGIRGSRPDPGAFDPRRVPQHLCLQTLRRPRLAVRDDQWATGEYLRHGAIPRGRWPRGIHWSGSRAGHPVGPPAQRVP